MAKSRKQKRPPRGAASPTSPKRVKAAARQAQAMQLREAGLSYEKIAEALGYRDRSSAYKAVTAGLKASRQDSAKNLRRLELRRLDKLFLPLWPLATAKPPDFAAIDRLLKIMQRRAALLDLDPKKVEEDNTKLIRVNWDELYLRQAQLARERADEFDPIEERIRQVTDGRPSPSVSPGVHDSTPEHPPPTKNGDRRD